MVSSEVTSDVVTDTSQPRDLVLNDLVDATVTDSPLADVRDVAPGDASDGCLPGSIRAVSRFARTSCAEEDNVNIPMTGQISCFNVTATHPAFPVPTDNCAADFANCAATSVGFPFGDFPSSDRCMARTMRRDEAGSLTGYGCKIADDGATAVWAVRQPEWWRPQGMAVTATRDGAVTGSASDAHFVTVSRNTGTPGEYPEFFVWYQDANARLIPFPPAGRPSVCFGSSVIIGPANLETRPYATITSLAFRHVVDAPDTLTAFYATGGSATATLTTVDRMQASVRVTVGYPTAPSFATVRSMFRDPSAGPASFDVERVERRDETGHISSTHIAEFREGCGISWRFYRTTRSTHNTSAPDLTIRRCE
jgi:hypothetical protein